MKKSLSNFKIDRYYILMTAVAVIFSWLLHEFAHWVTGNILGYKMVMTLNSTYPSSMAYTNDSDHHVISAAGPAITIIEALIVFFLINRRNLKTRYPFLFTCFYMRFFAMVISLLNPNDEARIGSYLGIGKFTLPVIVTAILFFLIYRISKRFGLSLKFNAITLALVIGFSSVVIMADQFFKIQVL